MGLTARKMHFMLIVGCGLMILTFAGLVDGRHTSDVKVHAEKLCKREGKGIHKIEARQPWWCCNCIAGYHKAADCGFGNPTNTTCEACVFNPKDSNNQTYTATENYRTHCNKSPNDSLCENSMNTYYVQASPTKSSSCKCKDGYFTPVATDILKHGCNKHSPCEAGFQPATLGTYDSDTRCEKCPKGSFSNVSSAILPCMSFSSCKSGERIVEKGTSTSDVVCSDDVAELVVLEHAPTDATDVTKKAAAVVINAQDQQFNSLLLVPIFAAFILTAIGVGALVCYIKRKQKPIQRNQETERKKEKLNASEEDSVLYTSSTTHDNSDDAFQDEETKGFLEGSECDDQHVSEQHFVEFVDLPSTSLTPRKSESETCECPITTNEKTIIQNSSPPLPLPVIENNIRNSECRNKDSGTGDHNATFDNQNSPRRPSSLSTNPTIPCLVTEIVLLVIAKWPTVYQGNSPSLRENIENYLKDYELGRKLLFCLQKHKTSDLKQFMRNILTDTEISDEEDNHPRNVSEMKYQWCSACEKKLGRTLTPRYLFDIKYERKIFRDDMMDVFIKNFEPRSEN